MQKRRVFIRIKYNRNYYETKLKFIVYDFIIKRMVFSKKTNFLYWFSIFPKDYL